MGTSHNHLDWPRLSYMEQYKEGDEADRKNKKRWEDNIKEWTDNREYAGLEWNILRKAENHEKWRKLVVKSPVVPQRSARLRDR